MLKKRDLAHMKARQARGGSWIQMFLNMGIITANAALFEDYFLSVGIDLPVIIGVGICTYVVGTILIGYLDEKYGVWEDENEFNTNRNPFMRGIRDNVENLKKEE